jgi:hypothetical protein
LKVHSLKIEAGRLGSREAGKLKKKEGKRVKMKEIKKLGKIPALLPFTLLFQQK